MRVTGDSMKNLAREVFDYELADDAAASVARIIGAMTLGLSRFALARETQPPFGYAVLIAESDVLRESSRNS